MPSAGSDDWEIVPDEKAMAGLEEPFRALGTALTRDTVDRVEILRHVTRIEAFLRTIGEGAALLDRLRRRAPMANPLSRGRRFRTCPSQACLIPNPRLRQVEGFRVRWATEGGLSAGAYVEPRVMSGVFRPERDDSGAIDKPMGSDEGTQSHEQDGLRV